MAKICVFLADGFEEIEALTVVDLLRRANQEVDMVSISKEEIVIGAHKIEVKADTLYEQVDFSKVEVLVLPGGMPGTTHLGEHKELMECVTKFANEGKWVCAICAAPSLLGRLGLLEGKEAVCYPGFEEQLLGARLSQEKVVRDGNIITSRGMGCAIGFSLEIIQQLCGEEVAQKIKTGIIYGH